MTHFPTKPTIKDLGREILNIEIKNNKILDVDYYK